MSVAIGLDIGTSGVKALAVAEDGEILGRAEVGYGLSTPQPGWAEQDPEDWWRATRQALEELDADDVAGIGLSGQMIWPASARHTPTRMPAARSPDCRCEMTAARSCAPCSRASRSGCVTLWI